MRHQAVLRAIACSGGVAVMAVAPGCGPDRVDPPPFAELSIVDVQAQAGGARHQTWQPSLLSDVQTHGQTVDDLGRLTVTVALTRPREVPVDHLDDVRLERCEIRFARTDGRRVEGVDVPFPLIQPLDALIPSEAQTPTEVPIVLVASDMKAEPPLSGLTLPQGELVIEAIAEVIIHGRSLLGEPVTAMTTIPVRFADFSDR